MNYSRLTALFLSIRCTDTMLLLFFYYSAVNNCKLEHIFRVTFLHFHEITDYI